jgi:hypothetical protein
MSSSSGDSDGSDLESCFDTGDGRSAQSSGSADKTSHLDAKSGASSERVIKTPAVEQVLDPAIDEGTSLPVSSNIPLTKSH